MLGHHHTAAALRWLEWLTWAREFEADRKSPPGRISYRTEPPSIEDITVTRGEPPLVRRRSPG
jgi:hypothetical protein